jgi:cytochrome P450
VADGGASVDVDLFDPATVDCPYDAYATLRVEAPAWREPRTGMWVITRYDDVRTILLDPARFPSTTNRRRIDPRAARIKAIYEAKGWVPAPTLAGRDDPEHRQMRALFNHAFRPARIAELDPFIADLAHRLLDALVAAGGGDWVRAFAVPLPLIVIGRQMGAPEEDIWRIKAWTDAWIQRLGMMQTDEELVWSTEQEIEAQHYFQTVFERLRAQPDDTLLSDLVNTEIPEWGRPLTDEELHAEMMADTFVGGSETTTNALSAGARILAERPDVWARLCADPGTQVPRFVEEVLRVESPVQGLFRAAAADVELGGVAIPAGSVLNIRFGAANRDECHFADPAEFDLDRDDGRSHLAFGFGTHHCLGAPLARRELTIGFRALVERVESLSLLAGANDFRHQPNFVLRALRELHVEVVPRR